MRHIGANWITFARHDHGGDPDPLAHLLPQDRQPAGIALQGCSSTGSRATRMVVGTGWLLSVMLLTVSWVPLTFISFLVARYLGVAAVVGA